MAELRINISKLSPGTHAYALRANAASLGLEGAFDSEIRVDVTLEKTGTQVLLSALVDTHGSFVCDRCLDDFKREVRGSFSIVYLMETRRDREDDPVSSEVQVLSPDTNYLDLDDDVRQYVLLSVPQKLLCREDCAGLCPTCGVNRNRETCSHTERTTDPRWNRLRDLSKN